MTYLLDTDHISILQRRFGAEHARLAARVAHRETELVFSIVSFHEQILGAHTYIGRARDSNDLVRGYRLMGEILSGFSASPVLPFDAAAMTVLEDLRRQRMRLATMDLRIAAIALARDLTLLTRNVGDFGRISQLRTENWID